MSNRPHTLRPSTAVRLLALAALLAAAMGCSDDATEDGGLAEGALAAVCPDPLVIQTDWYPEAEHGAVYQLLDHDQLQIDAGSMTVVAPLVSGGEQQGIDVEIRVGGPAIGFQQVAAQMYLDPDIFFGFVNTDEAIQTYDRLPTVGVLALLDISPQMIMWDPATYDVSKIADLPEDVVVNVFGPDAYLDHMVGTGILHPDQIDGGYTGSPSRFVAADGQIAQQGFATAEPYSYEHLIEEWGRPVRFELIHDTGWEVYAQALSVRPETIADHADCLELVVPIVQQAIVDYVTDPDATNATIALLVDRYDDGWVYERELADWSVEQQLELGIVGNGTDDTVGTFDLDRVQGVLDAATPVMELADPPSVGDLVTNRFVDPAISLVTD